MGDKTWSIRKPDEEAKRKQQHARDLGYRDSRDMKASLAADVEELTRENPAKKGTTEALLRGAKMMGANSMYSLLSGKSVNRQTTTVQMNARAQAKSFGESAAKKQRSLFG